MMGQLNNQKFNYIHHSLSFADNTTSFKSFLFCFSFPIPRTQRKIELSHTAQLQFFKLRIILTTDLKFYRDQ